MQHYIFSRLVLYNFCNLKSTHILTKFCQLISACCPHPSLCPQNCKWPSTNSTSVLILTLSNPVICQKRIFLFWRDPPCLPHTVSHKIPFYNGLDFYLGGWEKRQTIAWNGSSWVRALFSLYRWSITDCVIENIQHVPWMQSPLAREHCVSI